MTQVTAQDAGLVISQASLCWFLLPAGLAKFADFRGFLRGVGRYRLVPAGLVAPVAAAVPAAECGLGLALLLGVAPLISGSLTAALLCTFLVAAGINLARGNRVDCECHAIGATRVIGPGTIGRLMALVILAGGVVGLGALTGEGTGAGRPVWTNLSSAVDGVYLFMAAAGCVAMINLLDWAAEAESAVRAMSVMSGRRVQA